MRSRLFPLIWGIDAIIILIIGVVSIACLLIWSWSSFGSHGSNATAPTLLVENVPKERIIQENWRLHVDEITDSTAIITLRTDHHQVKSNLMGGSSVSKNQSIRNILFFDLKTQNSHWLFDSNEDRTIYYNILKTNASVPQVFGIRYQIQEPLTDSNNLEMAPVMIFYSNIKGQALARLIDHADRSLGYGVSAEGILNEFFIETGIPQAIAFDTRTNTVINKKPLM